MSDPTQPDSGSGFMSFLRGIPSAIGDAASSVGQAVTSPDAGRLGMAIWAASQGGPGALLNVMSYYDAQDAKRAKTVESPEFQDYVNELVNSGRAPNKLEAIKQAESVFTDAKGWRAPMAPELTSIDAPTGMPGTFGSEGPSLPDRKLMGMPQLPPVNQNDLLKYAISKQKIDSWTAPGVQGEYNRSVISGTPVSSEVMGHVLNNQIGVSKAIQEANPGYDVTAKIDQKGPGMATAANPNAFPGTGMTLTLADGTQVKNVMPWQLPGMDQNSFEFGADGRWHNKGLSPRAQSRESGIGAAEVDITQPGQIPGGVTTNQNSASSTEAAPMPPTGATGGTGPVSSLIKPGDTFGDIKAKTKAAEAQKAADIQLKKKIDQDNYQRKMDAAGNDQMVANIEKFINDESLPARSIEDVAIAPSLFGKAGEVAGGGLYQLGQLGKSWFPNSYPELKRLSVQVDGFLGHLARQYGGEKGVLTERDIARMRSVFDVTGLTQDLAGDVMQQIRENLSSIAERRFAENWRPEAGDRKVDNNGNPIKEPSSQGEPSAQLTPSAQATPANAEGVTREQEDAFRAAFRRKGQ